MPRKPAPVRLTLVLVRLPKAVNIATKTKPENIVISVDLEGRIWWNGALVPDRDELIKRVVVEAVKKPQPEVHIRGDAGVRYEAIGRTLYSIQRGGLTHALPRKIHHKPIRAHPVKAHLYGLLPQIHRAFITLRVDGQHIGLAHLAILLDKEHLGRIGIEIGRAHV